MKSHHLHNFTLTLLILSIGLTIGYSVGYYRYGQIHFPEIKIMEEDIHEKINTVHLKKIEGGKLIGESTSMNTRIIYNAEKAIETKEGQTFEIPLNQIKSVERKSIINWPKGTLFVASKNGKYFYSIFDKRAYQISTKNHLYFSDEKAAMKKGFLKAR